MTTNKCKFANMTNYKNCYILGCRNTSITAPDKIFITVPRLSKDRTAWLKAARRSEKDLSVKSNFFCCEDHFNLEEDMENYLEFKMMGVKKRMKKGVVPHIFKYQLKKKPSYKKSLELIYAQISSESELEKKSKIRTKSQPETSEQSETIITSEIKIEEHDIPETIKKENEDLSNYEQTPDFEFVNIKQEHDSDDDNS